MAEHTVDGDGNWVFDVSTAQELKEAFETNTDDNVPIIINILNNINYNQSPYYRWMSHFLYPNSYNKIDITINGNGHTLSNIYVYPGYSFICIPAKYANTARIVKINDLTFEIISNNGRVLNYEGYGAEFHLENCIFNVRAYDIPTNGIFNLMARNHEFINCVFNILLSSLSTNNKTIFVEPNTGSNIGSLYEACIFKIRNSTQYTIIVISTQMYTTIDNSAFFYNDVGLAQPDYNNNLHYILSNTADRNSFINSYIASFDYYPAMSTRPRIGLNTSSFNSLASSFYDKTKLNMSVYDNGTYTEKPPYFNACTTAQCKDSAYLSSIGYVFCEEA